MEAIDPSLLGVAGPSSYALGRIREIPSEFQLGIPGLSDSGSDDDDDQSEEDDDEEAEDEGDNEANGNRRKRAGGGDAEEEDDVDDEDEDEDDDDEGADEDEDEDAPDADDTHFAVPTSSARPYPAGGSMPPPTLTLPMTAGNKGKGREEPYVPQQPPSSTGAFFSQHLGPFQSLPPLPTPLTDVDTDYATDTPEGNVERTRAHQEELNRLISAIRVSSSSTAAPEGPSGRGMLGQEWDNTLQNELAEIDREEEESRAATGQRRRPRRGRGRVALADMEPTPEIRSMLGKANLSYVHGNTKEAIDILTEVIRIEPSTKAAWYTLASIHDDMGNREKALQLRIVPAHLSKSNAENWKELGSQSKKLGLVEQAIYCYTQALRVDRKDAEALWDRAQLYQSIGKTRQAIASYVKLLESQPHNPVVLRELGQLYFDINDVAPAIKLFSAAFDHFRSTVPIPQSESQIQGFSTYELEIFSDLLRSQRRFKEAANIITDGQRWLQGRISEEAVWKSFADDREYDLRRKARDGWEDNPQKWAEEAPTHPLTTGLRLRLGLCRLHEGRPDEAKIHFDILRAGDVVDNPEAWGEIADGYFEKKMWPEAMEVYYDMSECEETNVPAVWIKIAQCQKQLGDYQGACECYEAVIDSQPDDLDTKLALAEIYERLNRRAEALDLVNDVLAQRRGIEESAEQEMESQSGSEYTDGSAGGAGGDSDYEPAPGEVAEDGGMAAKPGRGRRRRERKRRAKPIRPRRTRSTNVVRRLTTLEERKAEDQRVQEAFDDALGRLQELDRMMEEQQSRGDAGIDQDLLHEWLEHAGFMIDTYRTTSALFSSDGKKRFTGLFASYKRKNKNHAESVEQQANNLASRLQASMADDNRPIDEPDENVEQNAYRGVSFDDWAKLTVRYGFMLTIVEEREEANDVLRHMLTSANMRQDVARHQLLVFGLTACAIWDDHHEEAVDDFRKILAARTAETEPIRILQALCSSGMRATDAIIGTKLQKYLLRKIKAIDQAALPSLGGTDAGDESDEGDLNAAGEQTSFKPTKVNPHFLMLYGHMMACGKSYQSAIVYYLRAYDMRPDDPLICLSLALAYTHRAMQRQTDNRHYQLVQAVALLEGYRKYRDNPVEMNYNVARVFHQLGILDLAVKHYEKVLELKDADTQDTASGMELDENAGNPAPKIDLSKEAAYNLSLIYFTRNAPDLARTVVDKYLSL